ncbi:MAG: Mov34/MPN/PAD-1 family protein [Acidobacteriota bacterium]
MEIEMLSLDGNCLETVVAWQRAAGILEVCGYCAVDAFGKHHLIQLTNHAGRPDAFEISPLEEETAQLAARQRGWQIVAFLHTHPSHSPDMSSRDALCFERDTLPWIIIGTPTSDPCQRTYVPTVFAKQAKQVASK